MVQDNKKIRVDVLTKADNRMIIIQNLQKRNAEVTIKLPNEKFQLLEEQFSDKKIKCKVTKTGVEFKLKLYPREVRVYRA